MRKKILFILLQALILLCSNAWADSFVVDGIKYYTNYSDPSTVYVGRNANNYNDPDAVLYSGDLVIPSTVRYQGVTYSVTSIEWYDAFSKSPDLKSITFPASAMGNTSINSSSFNGCTSLTHLNMVGESKSYFTYDGVLYYRNQGGYEGNTYIRDKWFSYLMLCPPGREGAVVICDTVTSLRYNGFPFNNCSKVTALKLSGESELWSEEDGVIYSKDKTKVMMCPPGKSNVILPASVTDVNTYAFYNNRALMSIVLPDGVTNIGSYAFSYCTNLRTINLPKKINTISEGMFGFCERLTQINIPEGVTSIGDEAFSGCTHLRDVHLPSTLTTIVDDAFYDCPGIKSIIIPASVTTISNRAFGGYQHITEIYNLSSVSIKKGSGMAIGAVAVHTSLDEPSIIEKQDGFMFVDKSANKTGSYYVIGYDGKDTNIILPDTYKGQTYNINPYAFCGTPDITSITCRMSTPPSQNISSAFYGVSTDIPVFVPSEYVATYKNANYWKDFKNIGSLESMITSISLSDTNKQIKVGDTYTLSATLSPEEPLISKLVWVSSDETVATVDMEGKITALSVGTATITATTTDGTKLSASCIVTVTANDNLEESTDISAYPIALYFNDVEHRAGDFNLELNMKCAEENITAFQCDVYLPEGVEWKSTTDKRGNIVYNLPTFNEDRTDNSYHTINPIAKNSDGSYKIIVYSMQKDNILETDGALLYLPLQISEEMESGEYNISVKNIVLTDVHTQQTLVDEVVSKLTIPSYVIGDANGDDMINVTDIVSIISYILGEADSNFTLAAADINGDGAINVTDIVGVIDIILNANPDMTPAMMSRAIAKTAPKVSGNDLEVVPFTVSEGTTSTTAKLNMNNPGDEFTAFQCEVEFPEGISWASTVDKRGNVKYTAPTFDAEADRTDASYHTVEIGKNASGNINIFVYSMQKEVILDEEGAVLDLPFVVDDNLTPGIYDVKIKNIVMTRTDQSDVKPADYTFSILVGSPAESTIALKGNFTDEAINEYNTALATNTTVAAIDLSDAADVSSNTAFATGNQNLVLYVAEDAVVKNTNNVVAGEECASLILTDGYSFAAPKAFTAVNASYSRTMDTTWGTICLPYAVASDESTAYYEITGVENDVLTLTKYDELPAGTPALVKKLSGTEIAPQATSVAVSGDINNVTGTAKMYGSYTNKVRVEDPNSYYIYNNKFYSCNDYFFCNAFRAYFTLESAGAKMLRIADDDDVVTAIDALTGEGNGIGVESIYGEDGILRKDMEKGMNIVKLSNGKIQKIIIK